MTHSRDSFDARAKLDRLMCRFTRGEALTRREVAWLIDQLGQALDREAEAAPFGESPR